MQHDDASGVALLLDDLHWNACDKCALAEIAEPLGT
jgi:hypothetical protein